MEAEVLNIEICNPTDEKLVAELFTIESIEDSGGGTPVFDGSALLYNTSGGAGNGSQMPSDSNFKSFLDTTNNIIYIATAAGLWIYDIATDTGSIIDTGTSVLGDALSSDIIRSVTKDISNDILYLVCGSDVWSYNINTNTGKLYTTASGVTLGVNLPSTLTRNCTYDSVNNHLWVCGDDFIWQLDITPNSGSDFSTPGTGPAFPTTLQSSAILYDSVNDLLFVGKQLSGLYQYDPATDTGLIFNTVGGAGSGSQIPSNRVNREIGIKNNTIYVPTNAGIWIYNIATDTGSIIDTGTSIINDDLPSDNVSTIYYSSDDDKLYVGGVVNFMWSYELATNTGTNIVEISGDARPVAFSTYAIYENGVLWDLLNSAGLWRYNEFVTPSGSPIVIQSQEGDQTSYAYITRDVQTAPIEISKITYTSENQSQKYNSLTHLIKTISGLETTYQVHFSNYVNPLLPFKTIHVDLEQPLLINYENFLQIPIEANTCVQLLFEYTQKRPVDLLERLASGDKKDISSFSSFASDYEKQKTVAQHQKPEINWLLPWIVLGIVSIALRLKQS